MGSQGHCCNPPLRAQSTAYLAASQARLVRASDSDKAACLLSLYVIFMDPTSRRSQALEGVQFGDIRVPPLLFFQWFHPSTDSHFWCAPEQVFAAEGDAVGMSGTTSKSESEAFRLHTGCISSVEWYRKASIWLIIYVYNRDIQYQRERVCCTETVDSIFKPKSLISKSTDMPLLWEWWNTGNNTFAAVRNLLSCREIPKVVAALSFELSQSYRVSFSLQNIRKTVCCPDPHTQETPQLRCRGVYLRGDRVKRMARLISSAETSQAAVFVLTVSCGVVLTEGMKLQNRSRRVAFSSGRLDGLAVVESLRRSVWELLVRLPHIERSQIKWIRHLVKMPIQRGQTLSDPGCAEEISAYLWPVRECSRILQGELKGAAVGEQRSGSMEVVF